MKNRNTADLTHYLTHLIRTVLVSFVLGACATPPPDVSKASFNGAKRVAIVNIAQSESLLLGGRYDPRGGTNGYAGAGATGIFTAFAVEGLAIHWAGNRREFNERAPANLAKDLQAQFTQLMQSEVAAMGRETMVVEINVPDRAHKDYWQLINQSIAEKCKTCDHALIISGAFGYSKGDRVLNPTADSFHKVVRLADATVTGFTPFMIQRDFSNNETGYEHYNDFRNDKRDHYAPLRNLPAMAARAIANGLR
jgi:hypothetical protein